MKKLFCIILCAVLLLGLLPLDATAATEYELYIAGVKVTSSNRADVLGDGAFFYNPETNTLIVRGDCTYGGSGGVIKNGIAGLTLYVEKDVQLKYTGTYACIFMQQSLKITGPGMLTICSSMAGIRGADNNRYALTIESARVDIKEAQKGRGGIIYCSKLDVTDSYLHSVDNIIQCGTIDLHDCAILEPEGAVITPYNCGSICKSSSTNDLAKNVVIAKTYGFKVGGKYVTKENKDDILGNGVFWYEPDTNTLTVNGKYNGDRNVIENYACENLKIYVAEDSVLKSGSDYAAINTKRDMSITGPGKLTLNGAGGIIVNDATLRITNAIIDIDGSFGGIYNTYSNSNSYLTIKNSYIHCKGVYTAISCCKGVTLDGCEIVSPEGGYINNGVVCKQNGDEAKEVVINAYYDLYIGGSQITALSAPDIGNGAFKYDPNTNILLVKKSFTASGTYPAVENRIPNLTIYAYDNATLSSSSAALLVKADTVITGPGLLSLTGTTCGVMVRDGAKLTAINAALAAGGGNGIMGINDGASLYIRSSHMIITSTDTAAVFNLASITLNDSIITSPSGAYIRGGDIVQSNGAYAKTVTISVPMTTIETVNLQVPKPVAGNTVTYEATAVNADGYDVEYDYYDDTWNSGVHWAENGATLDADKTYTFVSGNYYTVIVSIVITDTDRYKFAAVNEMKAYINGKEAVIEKYSAYNYGIRYTFDLTPPEVVTDINITIPEPEAGDLIYYYAKVPEGCGYRVQTELNNGLLWESGVAWYCDGSPLCPQDDEYFAIGSEYRIEISIVLTDEDRYEFGNMMDMYIIVNGHYADYTKVSDTKIIVHYYFTMEAELIDEILIYDFYKPAVGHKAGESENTVIYDDRFSIAETKWYCDTDHHYMSDYEEFEAGKLYSYCWNFTANAGYAFDEASVYVEINDGTDLVDTTYCAIGDTASEYVVWTVPAEPVNMISEVRINGYTAPTVGHTAGDNLSSISLPSGANYRVTFISWIVSGEETPMNESDIFENGKEYYISFSIEPKDGYSFCGQMPEVYINGAKELVGSARLYEYDDVLDGTTVLASFGTVIEEITVLGFKVPKTGQTVNEASASITAPASAHYEFDCYWYEEYGSGKPLSGDCVFEAGKTYELFIVTAPEAGYRFISPSVNIEGGQKYFNKGDLYPDGAYCIDLTGIEVTASSDIKYGDVNGDGKIDGKDLIKLRKYLLGTEAEVCPGADVNGDGKIDGKDLIKLRKYLLTEDESVLGPQ